LRTGKIFLTNDIDKNQSRLWSNIRYEWPNTGDLPRNRARFPSNPSSPPGARASRANGTGKGGLAERDAFAWR
jgi:hypothetical protein